MPLSTVVRENIRPIEAAKLFVFQLNSVKCTFRVRIIQTGNVDFGDFVDLVFGPDIIIQGVH